MILVGSSTAGRPMRMAAACRDRSNANAGDLLKRRLTSTIQNRPAVAVSYKAVRRRVVRCGREIGLVHAFRHFFAALALAASVLVPSYLTRHDAPMGVSNTATAGLCSSDTVDGDLGRSAAGGTTRAGFERNGRRGLPRQARRYRAAAATGDNAPHPRMPQVKDLPLLRPVGVMSSRCTIKRARTWG